MSEEDIVFLSYAREDARHAERLYSDLREAEVNVWQDTKCLLAGQNWRREIRSVIKRAKFFIALLSHSSLNKQGYVQSEIRQALKVIEEMPNGQVYLIPVRLDAVTPEDEELQDLNWVDLFPDYRGGISRILQTLEGARRHPLEYDSSNRAPIQYIPFRSFAEFARDFVEKLPRSAALTDHDYSILLTCKTRHPGLELPEDLKAKYPTSISIVLQHQFEGLEAGLDAMSVVLWFGGKPSKVRIPYNSIVEISLPGSGIRVENLEQV